jgi:hypothetical protein
MTKRQRIIEKAALELNDTEGVEPEVTWERVVEVLTDLGHVDAIDEYDWPRLREAIRRKHSKLHRKSNATDLINA